MDGTRAETCRSLILVMNCVSLGAFFGSHVSFKNTNDAEIYNRLYRKFAGGLKKVNLNLPCV